jgi:hypothetical protein
MAIPNHSLCYRPVRAGITILNPNVGKVGTVGFIATANGQDRWLVSCYHVLGRIDLSPFNDGEPIYQPIDDPQYLIARMSTARADAQLDCAAAELEAGIQSTNEILELSPLAGISEPVVGTRVIKSGCVTGVTEGVISQVTGDAVEIQIAPGFPSRYELSQEGDSGSVWVSSHDSRAVALHRAGNAYGKQISLGVRLSAVLTRLNLQLI